MGAGDVVVVDEAALFVDVPPVDVPAATDGATVTDGAVVVGTPVSGPLQPAGGVGVPC